MKSLIIFFAVVLSLVNAVPVINPGYVQVGPVENSVLIKGPSTSTNVAGPDGSVINSNADAGAIASSVSPGIVVQPQPLPFVIPSPVGWPLLYPYLLPNLPWVLNRPGAIINGPSGSIIASN